MKVKFWGFQSQDRVRFFCVFYSLAIEAGSYNRCSSSSIQLKPLQYSVLRSNRFVAIDRHLVELYPLSTADQRFLKLVPLH